MGKSINESLKMIYENLPNSLKSNFVLFAIMLDESVAIIHNLGLISELRERLKEQGVDWIYEEDEDDKKQKKNKNLNII